MNTDASSPTKTPRFLTVPQAADLLAVHPSTIRRWINDGRLAAYRVGDKGVRLMLADVLDLATPLERAVTQGVTTDRAEGLGTYPLTEQEQKEALAASAATRTFRQELGRRYGEVGSSAGELLNEARDQRTEELVRATES